jgi:aspartate/methionine/tyrosine aminotransferase
MSRNHSNPPKPRTEDLSSETLADLLREAARISAIDLALGVPPFPVPAPVADAAISAIIHGPNQYPDPWGDLRLRQAIADEIRAQRGVAYDPETEVTVTVGATTGMYVALLSAIKPGDEVVVFEPFYGNHVAAVRLVGGIPRPVRMRWPDWSFDPADLDRAFTARTRAVVMNTPHNPTGKVFSRSELELIAEQCARHDAVVLCDEIYEAFIYDRRERIFPSQVPALRDRAVTLGGFSKTYMISGWRLGYALASAELSGRLRAAHNVVTGGATAPLQAAAPAALGRGDAYRHELCAHYQKQRDRLIAACNEVGLRCHPSEGGVFFMADISSFQATDDKAFARWVLREAGVLVAPGSYFFADPIDGRDRVRLCFSKTDETMNAGLERLARLAGRVTP